MLFVVHRRWHHLSGGLCAHGGHPARGPGGERRPGHGGLHHDCGLLPVRHPLRLQPAQAGPGPAGTGGGTRAARRAARPGASGGRGGQRVEVGLPRQHVPRHPHPHERRARLYHHYREGGRQSGQGARLRRQDHGLGTPSARSHQRRAGHLEDRERQGVAYPGRVRSGRLSGRGGVHHRAHGPRQGADLLRGDPLCAPRAPHRRRDAPQPDFAEPAVERREVHPGGRPHLAALHRASGAFQRAGTFAHRGRGRRLRHDAGVP